MGIIKSIKQGYQTYRKGLELVEQETEYVEHPRSALKAFFIIIGISIVLAIVVTIAILYFVVAPTIPPEVLYEDEIITPRQIVPENPQQREDFNVVE